MTAKESSTVNAVKWVVSNFLDWSYGDTCLL